MWHVKTCPDLFQNSVWLCETARRYSNEDQKIEIGIEEMGDRGRKGSWRG